MGWSYLNANCFGKQQMLNAKFTWLYNKALEEMSKLAQGPKAVKYLLDVPQQWSMSTFDPDAACHHNTNNFVESFNSIINKMRELPVFALMEEIRTYHMDKYAERLDLADGMELTDIAPYASGEVQANCVDSWHCSVVKASRREFEVFEGSTNFVVDILNCTCVCGAWQVFVVPCKHACWAIYHNKEEPIYTLCAWMVQWSVL